MGSTPNEDFSDLFVRKPYEMKGALPKFDLFVFSSPLATEQVSVGDAERVVMGVEAPGSTAVYTSEWRAGHYYSYHRHEDDQWVREKSSPEVRTSVHLGFKDQADAAVYAAVTKQFNREHAIMSLDESARAIREDTTFRSEQAEIYFSHFCNSTRDALAESIKFLLEKRYVGWTVVAANGLAITLGASRALPMALLVAAEREKVEVGYEVADRNKAAADTREDRKAMEHDRKAMQQDWARASQDWAKMGKYMKHPISRTLTFKKDTRSR